nr:ATP synthase F0 subunit 6 [Cimex lectularius]
MMANLFSSFDPSTSIISSLNWYSTIIGLMMIPPMYWTTPSRITMLFILLYYKLYTEFKITMSKPNAKMNLMMISMFMFILTNNMMGLLPYVFTSSSHMVYSLSLSLPLWLALMMYTWINFTNKTFTHMLPNGTPALLMPFLVCIETVSNIIRPMSLAIRLTANMIAGHLFMVLLGNLIVHSEHYMLIVITQTLLMMFELCVSFIQAYVFTTLSTLYIKEVAYETSQ